MKASLLPIKYKCTECSSYLLLYNKLPQNLIWFTLATIFLCLLILSVRNFRWGSAFFLWYWWRLLGGIQLAGLCGPRCLHPVSATLVDMARRLASAGTSTIPQNHRTQNHHHGCFIVIWHLTWWVRAPRECNNMLEWKLQGFLWLSLGKPGSFLPNFICHESHWGQGKNLWPFFICHSLSH